METITPNLLSAYDKKLKQYIATKDEEIRQSILSKKNIWIVSQEDISYDWNNFYNTIIDVNGKVTTYGHEKPTYGYWNKFDEVICTDDAKNIEKWVCTESGAPGVWKSVSLN